MHGSVLFEKIRQIYIMNKMGPKGLLNYLIEFKKACFTGEPPNVSLSSDLMKCASEATSKIQYSENYIDLFKNMEEKTDDKHFLDYVKNNRNLVNEFMPFTPSMMINNQIINVSSIPYS